MDFHFCYQDFMQRSCLPCYTMMGPLGEMVEQAIEQIMAFCCGGKLLVLYTCYIRYTIHNSCYCLFQEDRGRLLC